MIRFRRVFGRCPHHRFTPGPVTVFASNGVEDIQRPLGLSTTFDTFLRQRASAVMTGSLRGRPPSFPFSRAALAFASERVLPPIAPHSSGVRVGFCGCIRLIVSRRVVMVGL